MGFAHLCFYSVVAFMNVFAEEECMLCDNPANCKFILCGHAVMCMECAIRTEKCPECKVPLVNSICYTMYHAL